MEELSINQKLSNKYDKLLVLVSYDGTKKLLAVPKLTSESGKSMALAVKAWNDWELKDKVVAMGFDTTRSNTGQKKYSM